MRDNAAPTLTELDALTDRIGAVLGRLRAFRACLADQLVAGEVRLDLVALQGLAEEIGRLTATGDAIALDAGVLVGHLRP